MKVQHFSMGYCPPESTLLRYLCAFSKYSYYTMICPYNITLSNKVKEPFVFKSNLFQQIFSAFFHLTSIYSCFSVIYNGYFTGNGKNIREDPREIFAFASNFAYCVMAITFSYIVWFGRRRLMRVYKAAYQCFPIAAPLSKSDYITMFLMFGSQFFFSIGLICAIVFFSVQSEKGFKGFFEKNIILKFLDGKLNSYSIPAVQYTFSIIYILYSFLASIMSNGLVLYINGMLLFTTYKIGKEVKNFFIEHEDIELRQVVDYHHRVKKFLQEANETLSMSVLIFVTSCMIFFCKSFNEIIESSNISHGVITAVYFMYSVVLFLIGAEGAAKLKAFGDYVFEHRHKYGYKSTEVLAMLAETATNPLGLKAYTFLVTYGFITNVFSTVLTYSMVLLQFSVKGSSPSNQTLNNEYYPA